MVVHIVFTEENVLHGEQAGLSAVEADLGSAATYVYCIRNGKTDLTSVSRGVHVQISKSRNFFQASVPLKSNIIVTLKLPVEFLYHCHIEATSKIKKF